MRRRPGFTIIELLVSLALILFVMVILTEAFTAGLETFRQLKAIGDMQERLRSAALVMRRDLKADHFKDLPNGGSRLSDVRLDQGNAPPDYGYFRIAQRFPLPLPNPAPGITPVPQALYVPPNPPFSPGSPFLPYFQDRSILEGLDTVGSQGIPVTRQVESWMSFTVWQHGPRPEDWMSAALPPAPPNGPNGDSNANSQLPSAGGAPQDFQPPAAPQQPTPMLSQWAEVAYFLRPLFVPGTSPPVPLTANGTQLYALYRRQRLLGTQTTLSSYPYSNASLQQASSWPYYYDVSFPQPVGTQSTSLNSPLSITRPYNRIGMQPWTTQSQNNTNDPALAGIPAQAWTIQDFVGSSQTAGIQSGDDLILSDVLSFDIKVLQQGGNYDYNGVTSLYDGKLIPVFVDLPPGVKTQNPVFQQTPAGTGVTSVFDTWSSQGPYSSWQTAGTPTSLPLAIRIVALQITLRVWDARTQQARQLTIIQDM